MTASATLDHLAGRFFALLDRMTREIGDRVRSWPQGANPGLIPLARVILIQAWLFKRRSAVMDLITRFRDGTLRPPRPARPRRRPPDLPDKPPRRPPPPLEERIPTRFGWLSDIANEARRTGVWLGELAAVPAMRELAAATPRTGRLLRPLLQALGEEVPEWLKPPPRPRRERPPRRPALHDRSRRTRPTRSGRWRGDTGRFEDGGITGWKRTLRRPPGRPPTTRPRRSRRRSRRQRQPRSHEAPGETSI